MLDLMVIAGHIANVIVESELPRHLHDHGYGFNKDLKVSVLDKVNGGYELQAFKEVEWISQFSILQ